MNLSGQRFGRWSVLKQEKDYNYRGKKVPRWLCVCDCGKQRVVIGFALRAGNSSSCGCKRHDSTAKKPYESLYNLLLKTAKERDLAVSLSYKQFVDLTTETKCHYCGVEIMWARYNHGKNGNCYNLDRKDNSTGYTSSNVVVCCTRCNYGKGKHFTYEEWAVMTTALKGMRAC